MAKKREDIPEIVMDDSLADYDYTVDDDAALVDYAVIRELIDPTGANVKARDFTGIPFYIEKARKFESDFEGQSHAYFVVAMRLDNDQRVNFVIGGAQPMIVLTAIVQLPPNQKIGFGLEYHEGKGDYQGYYTLIGANEVMARH